MKPVQIAVIAALAVPADAAGVEITGYTQCVALVDSNAQAAEQGARDWQTRGGGAAAMHCHALALTALRRYGEAARVLDALARNRDIAAGDRADLFDQAGNAWLLAGQGREAVTSLSAALAARPDDGGILADRARARGVLQDWSGADADLSAALLQDQDRADLLVLRASARWALGRKVDAATDIVRALALYPDYPPALLERGKMKYSAGDRNGARADWKKAAAAGRGDVAAEARRALAALDASPPISAQ